MSFAGGCLKLTKTGRTLYNIFNELRGHDIFLVQQSRLLLVKLKYEELAKSTRIYLMFCFSFYVSPGLIDCLIDKPI